MPDFSKFDLERTPRPIQADTLAKLNAQWNDTDCHPLILPTGAGKSALARAIQVATGADIITPSNILVAQYESDYPKVNSLKGKAHYICKTGMTCKDWTGAGFDACDDCPYEACKTKALTGDNTFFNPMSLYYFLLSTRTKGNKVLVVDEAHQFGSMILMLCSKKLKRSEYKFSEKVCNEVHLVVWLKQQIDRLDRLAEAYHKARDTERTAKAKNEIETLALLKEGLEEDGQNYVIWISKDAKDTYLNIKPLFPPRFLLNRLIGGKKLVLMSGTLFDYDIRSIIGADKTYKTIEQNSPIPRKNRRIVYKPAPFKINYQTPPQQLVEYVEQFVPTDGTNTIIHSTYSLSKKICDLFSRPIIFNTNEDKDERVEEFKTKGGILLGSGCAEGLDLKYDLCRTNIIPKLAFPDLGDPGVQKRKSLQDGDEWYAFQTFTTLIQQAGRSTRAVDDFSTTYILDPNFERMFKKYRHKLPKYFVESVEL